VRVNGNNNDNNNNRLSRRWKSNNTWKKNIRGAAIRERKEREWP